jgi:hypothetical protein
VLLFNSTRVISPVADKNWKSGVDWIITGRSEKEDLGSAIGAVGTLFAVIKAIS